MHCVLVRSAAQHNFGIPLPGGSGSRNVLRGDGYAYTSILALSKRWKMPFEGQTLRFRWEVFNVLNLVRLDNQTWDQPSEGPCPLLSA
jgi:hypothetical protein